MNSWIFVSAALSAFFITLCATWLVRRLAVHWGIVDTPNARKIHRHPIPLLGGVALVVGVYATSMYFIEPILARGLTPTHLMAVAGAGLLLVIGGVLDDIFTLSPIKQVAWPLVAAGILAAGGVGITQLTNPLGGLLTLSVITTTSLTFLWVLGMMYTTKLLDGVDGLVGGLGAIAGTVIFLFTLTTQYYQPDVGLLALIFAASCLGFLVFNFNPASIFLGESGSLLIGYIIAVLAIISGGKIAVAFLVVAIPVFDVVWVIARRVREGKNPFRSADRKHLHHRLLDMGLSQRQTVLVYYSLATIFGVAALFLQSRGKMYALLALAALMVLFILISPWVTTSQQRRARRS